MVINKFPNREVYEKIKAKGSLGADDVNVLEDYPGLELTEADKTEIAGKVIADGTEFTLADFPTALKNPNALTFTGAATGTYDGSAPLTINIPAGGSSGSGSGGALKAMSAVSGDIGIPAADLPENGVVWMCFGSGGSTELYTGTVTIQNAGIAVNDMLVITNGTVNPLDQVSLVSEGLAVYGLSTNDYRGVWQQVGAGGGSPINWRGEYSAQTAYNRLDAVSYNGSSYVFVSATSTTGAIPGIDEEWQLLAQKGDSGESLSLGMTSAAVGQIAKISAVDANGVPTAWEPVDMPSGGGSNWVKVYDGSSTIAEEVSSFEVNLSKSDPMKEFQLWLKLDKNTAEDWGEIKNINVKVNGANTGYFAFSNRLNAYVEFFAERSFEAMTVGKRLLITTTLNFNWVSPNWLVGQGNKQTNDGKLSISFPAPYAGKITAIVFGRY